MQLIFLVHYFQYLKRQDAILDYFLKNPDHPMSSYKLYNIAGKTMPRKDLSEILLKSPKYVKSRTSGDNNFHI